MRIFFIIIILIGFGSSAFAQNTGGVFGPVVNDGHRALQYRITVDPDNANDETGVAQRLHYEQSFNGDLMWRIVGATRKTAESDLDFDFVQAELFWQITDDAAAIQSGLRFDARYRGDDRPEQFGVNWMNQFQVADGWTGRILALTAAQSGDNAADGVFLQTRASLSHRLAGGQTIGVEMYNNLGNSENLGSFKAQGHQIGPAASLPVGNGVSLYGGVLFGLSERAADTELRLWLTKGF